MIENNDKFSRARREMIKTMAALGTATVLPAFAAGSTAQPTVAQPHPSAVANKARPSIAILIYPGMVMLDMIGPQTVFNIAGCQIDLVWKDRTPVTTEVGIPLVATKTFDEYTQIPDVLLVPGGLMGTIQCMNDPQVLAFLQDKGAQAQWITSVCTGSLVLAGAGLLQGYRATSHWGVRDLLPLMGATLSIERVVVDRNRMTGGGVTAGIDFGLLLLEKLQGREAAEQAQLIIEYAPAPPFNVGTPELAGPERMKIARKQREKVDSLALEATKIAQARLNSGS